MSRIKELFGVEIGEEFEIKEEATSSTGNWRGCYFNEEGQLRMPGMECETPQRVMGALIIGEAEIIKHEKPILTDEEREYLRAVCKPFEIDVVVKYSGCSNNLLISILLVNGDFIDLHHFSCPSRMYKGMELNKQYTPEELGL